MNNPDLAQLERLSNSLQHGQNDDSSELFPADAPFSDTQRSFLTGLFAGRRSRLNSSTEAEVVQTPLTILYASQTGTAEALSKNLRKVAAQHGFSGSIAELDSVTPADLASVAHLLIVAATCGEGEPPDNAQSFYRLLMADAADSLPATLNFSVCGLGDSSYAHFNHIARQLDVRLGELGATRATPLVACDADYDDEYEGWRQSVFECSAFTEAAGAASPAIQEAEEAPESYTRKRPFVASLLNAQKLSDDQSAKTVNHIELSLASCCEQLTFEVGDALGVWPLNDLEEVNAILGLTGVSGGEIVQLKTGAMALRQALHRALDLRTVTKSAEELWGVAPGEEDEVLDVLKGAQCPPSPQDLVDGLRLLQPRLYSISSSPRKHPGEVHLTIGVVRYELQGQKRKGVASTFVGERLTPGGALGIYVQKASHFGLPADDEIPLIMIGPGTGIAPFRAFLEEREMREASGDNWLFFGDQHEATDYLYRDQIDEWCADGLINRLSLAWSRDAQEKIYVQHLIAQEGEEFFRWLERGAAIYVCGDATRMAGDVEQAILAVIRQHGGMSSEEANLYLDGLRKSHRYQRDVY